MFGLLPEYYFFSGEYDRCQHSVQISILVLVIGHKVAKIHW